MAIQLFILALLLLAAPAVIGGVFQKVDGFGKNLFFRWICGQFILWAGFQLICVPLILQEKDFRYLVQLFSAYMAAMVLLGMAVEIRRLAKAKKPVLFQRRQGADRQKRSSAALLWAGFWAVLVFQLIQAVRLSYADTDDAFYVAISSVTQTSDTMYQVLPYTGGGTLLDKRHGLAPFPIWISYLARVSGMQAVTVAKVVLPVVLISMSYVVFYLLARVLFPEKGRQVPLFLLFAEVLVLFGNYSIYTVENFMIARSRQGKAALGSIVIPFLLFLLLFLFKKIQEKGKVGAAYYFLLGTVTVTGCLCSTLGALLVCLAIGAAGMLGAICYKRIRVGFPLAACCAPCLLYAFLYLFLK